MTALQRKVSKRRGLSYPAVNGSSKSALRCRDREKKQACSRVGSGQEVLKSSRVGSGRVKRYLNLSGRVRSGQ